MTGSVNRIMENIDKRELLENLPLAIDGPIHQFLIGDAERLIFISA